MARNRDAYFAKFPIISYNGAPAIDLIKRVDFNDKVQGFLSAFYPLNIDEGSRIDSIAYDYYDSPDYDWLIYHSNGIIDPYHDVNINHADFEQHLRAKYGSVRNANRKTVWYETNGDADDTILSEAAYNSLTSDIRKHWDPIPGPLGAMGYQRSSETLYASTNQILQLAIDSISGDFEIGENVVRDETTYAELASVATDDMIVQHVRGDFEGSYSITGERSGATASVTATTVLVNVIPIDERVYYRPVTAYDLEFANNDRRRELYLIDRSYKERLNTQLEELLQ